MLLMRRFRIMRLFMVVRHTEGVKINGTSFRIMRLFMVVRPSLPPASLFLGFRIMRLFMVVRRGTAYSWSTLMF